MKIVNREQFLKMPEGTVYTLYEPCCFYGGLIVKWESLKNDWYKSLLHGWISSEHSDDFFKKSEQYANTGESFEFDLFSSGRDGCFEEKQLFAVYEEKDIKMLICRLQGLLSSDSCRELLPKATV